MITTHSVLYMKCVQYSPTSFLLHKQLLLTLLSNVIHTNVEILNLQSSFPTLKTYTESQITQLSDKILILPTAQLPIMP